MNRMRLVLGVLLVLVGLVWTGQGIGWIGGSSMTGEPLWALLGPLVAVAGVLVVLRSRR
ncbi:hypothetical protein [Salsipaludibacter albus]|uniref:hypothetical protein n=1 Tax=Salsipaludibacter albus TaxID=2849650 RepID=UPI001EE4BB4C|nr:hypothetical protein [Salsipaludibacter albus]MBY5161891.1 hypothetical protein [Salsipaludibacter albus]